MKVNNYLIIAAAESGQAFLDLYDHTGDRKYLEAAQRIAATYLKTQLPNGTWRLYLNPHTGEPTAGNLAIPTSTINYLERLRDSYGLKGFDDAIARAVAWIMENPVKTFEWLAQYEDIPLANRAPYQKMSREQTCDLAIYLCRRRPQDPKAIALVEDLIRFCEDQFVTWEQIEDVLIHSGLHRPPYKITPDSPGWFSVNWLTPVVHEQYGFWMPSGRNTALMIETYWHAYRVTKKEVYRAKALSIANNFTRVQKEHNGDYPTMFTKYPMNFWINNAIYPARVMVNLHEELKRSAQ
jgi:maltose/maltodextrin transport system substrate-binding protein